MTEDRSMTSLLQYERQVVEEFLDSDGLCILAAGLAWQRIVAAILHLHDYQKPGALLVLGCTQWQKKLIIKELARHNAKLNPPVDVNNEISAQERIELYRMKRCCFVTTRILVVDFLSNRVLPKEIAGMVVMNAHRVDDTSGEGFAVRLLRQGNKGAYIRAISDMPTSFVSAFNKVEKVMKALNVRRLSLWPRFQQAVQDQVDRHGIDLVEFQQELTPAALMIHEAICTVLQSLLGELQKTNRIDCSDMNLEEGLHRSFEGMVRHQLDKIWHTLSWKTKTIVRDLKTVQSLALYLLRYDCVTFLTYLEDLRQSEGARTVWLFHEATHTIFEQARRRVYLVGSRDMTESKPLRKGRGAKQKGAGRGPKGTSDVPPPPSSPLSGAPEGVEGGDSEGPPLIPVLEEVPKWSTLLEVLEEVQKERKAWGEQGRRKRMRVEVQPDESVNLVSDDDEDEEEPAENVPNPRVDAAPCDPLGPVLVVVRELHMCTQLEAVVREGGQAVMWQLYENYLLNKWERTTERGRSKKDRLNEMHSLLAAPGPSVLPHEATALMMAAQSIGMEKGLEEGGARWARRGKKRGGSGGRGRGSRQGHSARQKIVGDDSQPPPEGEEDEEVLADEACVDKPIRGGRGRGRCPNERGRGCRAPSSAKNDNVREHAQGALTLSHGGLDGTGPLGTSSRANADASMSGAAHPLLEDVHFYALDSHEEEVLWDLCPSFIIMYDPDLAFVRQVEVYHCSHPSLPLRVYYLYYQDSLERDQYMAAVKREQDAFAKLIHAKQHLVLPTDTSGQQIIPRVPGVSPDDWLDLYQKNKLTRQAGGRELVASGSKGPPRLVVVDVREFMSHLPAVLHQQGFDLVPVTLEVGDYVLSPEMCVERKALPDLFSSLNSGRLFNQAEAMCRHYKTPILLIEFDQDKAFMLQNVNDLGPDIDARSASSKLVLLTLHFPRLRLIWSRSLHATAEIFANLKSNQDEPDPPAAALVGVPLGGDGLPLSAGSSVETVINQSAVELLRALPGVNESNYRQLMQAAGSLVGLAGMSQDTLGEVMGSTKNAKALRDFLDTVCPRL